MTIQEFRDYMASGKPVVGGGDVHMMFHKLSQEALQITAEINGKYHTPEQLHDLLEQLWVSIVRLSRRMCLVSFITNAINCFISLSINY